MTIKKKGNAIFDVDNKVNPLLYAEIYSKLNIQGTIYLAYRDLPSIIHQNIKGKKTLDYGCGAGKSTMFLQSLGLDVDGTDINPRMIEQAKIFDNKINYFCLENGKIPICNDTYDFVLAAWVLMEVSTKEELKKYIAEISRVLKKSGIFIALVCTREAYGQDWLTTNTEFKENENICSGSQVKVKFKDIDLVITDFYWSEEDYRPTLTESGFIIKDVLKPLGKDTDEYNWGLEKEISPYAIYVVQKS